MTYAAAEGGAVSVGSETVSAVTGAPQGSVATPDAGWRFSGWFDAATGTQVSADAAFVPQRSADGVWVDAAYEARFARDEPAAPEPSSPDGSAPSASPGGSGEPLRFARTGDDLAVLAAAVGGIALAVLAVLAALALARRRRPRS